MAFEIDSFEALLVRAINDEINVRTRKRAEEIIEAAKQDLESAIKQEIANVVMSVISQYEVHQRENVLTIRVKNETEIKRKT